MYVQTQENKGSSENSQNSKKRDRNGFGSRARKKLASLFSARSVCRYLVPYSVILVLVLVLLVMKRKGGKNDHA